MQEGINRRKVLGRVLKVLGWIMFVVFGLWGFALELLITYHVAGLLGVVVGFFLAPVVLFVAPWYAAVAWGAWLPLVVIYGGLLPGGALLNLADRILEAT